MRFHYELSHRLGLPVAEMLDRMSAGELARHRLFMQQQVTEHDKAVEAARARR